MAISKTNYLSSAIDSLKSPLNSHCNLAPMSLGSNQEVILELHLLIPGFYDGGGTLPEEFRCAEPHFEVRKMHTNTSCMHIISNRTT
jgi:hypothetical protein